MMICPQCGKTYDGGYEVCPADNRFLIDEAAARLDPLLGTVLADRYQIVQKVGQGGMGAIYKAVHTRMDRICAIKLLTSISGHDEAAIARFNREAKMASRIDNPHAVTIYDYGEAESGIPYLAMEFIDGKALSQVLAAEKSLSLERTIHITSQIAEALSAAHAMGIVHRDLKPDNIMLTKKGSDEDYVKVLDFGIAKTVADDGNENLTKTGFVLGTPAYMSPEQLSGEKLDARSDIYSLAIMVYEMLSGRLPFEGENQQSIMIKRITAEPTSLRIAAPSVSDSVERVVMDALARNREDRIASVDAFARALRMAEQASTQEIGSRATNVFGQDGAGQEAKPWSGPQTVIAGAQQAPQADDDQAKTVALGKPTSNIYSESSSDTSSRKPAPPSPPQKTVVYEKAKESAAGQEPQMAWNPPRPQKDETKAFGVEAARQKPSDEPIVVESAPARSRWMLYGAAVVAIAALALMAFMFMPGGASGYTLVIKGAPPQSDVFVNGVRRGATGPDGSIKIEGIDPGRAEVRVSREGFAEFEASISGGEGEAGTLEAKLLPFEIDLKGAMVLIPAGEFVFGSNNYEEDEKPEQWVDLPAFYIDKYEVTNAQYKAFCDATGARPPANPVFDSTYFESKPDSPVLGITREDAKAYAKWAGKRLPTEAEWEKAAGWDPNTRAKRQWPWGDDGDISRANLGTGKPAPVTDYPSDRSAYGVYGMAGNAYEWVDSYYEAYKGNTTPNADFQKEWSAVRGGNFLIRNPGQARTTYRNNLPAVFSGPLSTPVGFRCAISADEYIAKSR